MSNNMNVASSLRQTMFTTSFALGIVTIHNMHMTTIRSAQNDLIITLESVMYQTFNTSPFTARTTLHAKYKFKYAPYI